MLKNPQHGLIAENTYEFFRLFTTIRAKLECKTDRQEIFFSADYGIPDYCTDDLLFVLEQFLDNSDQCFFAPRPEAPWACRIVYYPGLVAN